MEIIFMYVYVFLLVHLNALLNVILEKSYE